MTTTQQYKDLEAKYYMQVVRRMSPVLVRGDRRGDRPEPHVRN